MSNDQIMEKIKKCLALAKSSNEHEAAAALRQAQKLMELHGISDADVLAAGADEQRTKAGATMRPVNWETRLASKVAATFGCHVIFSGGRKGEWAFIGCGAAPEIASYAFAVLFRQAKRARADYIDDRLKRCKRGTQVRRADLFCEGWVSSATAIVEAFAGNEQQDEAIKAFIATRYPALTEFSARSRTGDRKLRDHEYGDHIAGRRAGQDAQINRGCGSQAGPLALE